MKAAVSCPNSGRECQYGHGFEGNGTGYNGDGKYVCHRKRAFAVQPLGPLSVARASLSSYSAAESI
eukprot:3375773-Amphidinium_carterae.1